jgi:hypothetical protein
METISHKTLSLYLPVKNEIKNYLLTFTSPSLIQTLKSIKFMILCSIQIQLANKYSTGYINTTLTIYNHITQLITDVASHIKDITH